MALNKELVGNLDSVIKIVTNKIIQCLK